jgi:release factor glutamine methyltransferase
LRSTNSIIVEFCQNNSNEQKNLRKIIAKIKKLRYDKLIFDAEDIYLNSREEKLFYSMVERYRRHEPISKIINHRSFWNGEFLVNSHVFDPRPETELIIEMILSRFDRQHDLNFLDLGTGSGCILLSLLGEYKNSRGVGLDISPEAIKAAKYNQKKHKIKNADFMLMDWRDFDVKKEFDVIVSNPPYIKTDDIPLLETNVKDYDPLAALDGGTTGLEAYISILSSAAARRLKSKGSIFLEIGCGQFEDVSKIIHNHGFEIHEVKKDLNGIDRIIGIGRG